MAKVLRVGLIQPVKQTDPREAADFINMMVLWQVYEPPYAPSTGEVPDPLLFKEALRAEGPSAWSAELVEGACFSDGTPLTPDHVAACLSSVGSLRTNADVHVSGRRIVFRVKRPYGRFEPELSLMSRSIVMEKGGRLLGTGAFVPAPGSTPERMRLVRNPHYRVPVAVDEVEFLVFPPAPDGANPELKKALADGRIDFTTFLRRDEVTDMASVRKSVAVGTSTAMLFFNTERGVFRDRTVRLAAAQSVDRLAIAQLFYQNPLAYVANGPIPPGIDSVRDEIHHDPARAKKMLTEAGFEPPREPLRLAVICGSRPYLPQPRLAAEKIAADLAALGLQVRVEVTRNVLEYYQRAEAGDCDLVLGGWIPDTPDAADLLDAFLHSNSVPTPEVGAQTVANVSRWRDPETDAALQRFRAERSEPSRFAVSQVLSKQVPFLPLIYGAAVVVHSWRVRNYPPRFPVQPRFAALDVGD